MLVEAGSELYRDDNEGLVTCLVEEENMYSNETFIRQLIQAINRSWPKIWHITKLIWLIVIAPTCILIFNFICWFLDEAEDDVSSTGGDFNLFTGEYDVTKRTDGSYSSDATEQWTPRH